MSRKNFVKTGQMRSPLPATPEKMAAEWWREDGIYIDPNTDEVDWFDKRRELAELAFIAGYRKASVR